MAQTHYRHVLGHAMRRVPEHGHERATHTWVCREIARLLDVPDAGVAGHGVIEGGTFHVPDDTLTIAQARGLGIDGVDDLLGGIVPHAFLATKVIGHPLIGADAARPAGWDQALAMSLIPATLPGYTAFSRPDAMHAFEALSGGGDVRLKLPTGVGGNDQWRIADASQLAQVLDSLPETYLGTHGGVLERNILQPMTHSVGELCLAGVQIAYYGTQCSVPDADGSEVYGGSSLRVFRGSLEALMATALPLLERQVVEQACRYDRCVTAAYPELQISRRNYDVVSGRDAINVPVCGVLEQSWRIGGATPAELAAIAAFQHDPALQWVNASTHEIYQGQPPADAQVYYRATQSGPGPRYKCRSISAT